jgi:GntR family transcriptional repressor for pyruvate dehydrogenase complex
MVPEASSPDLEPDYGAANDDVGEVSLPESVAARIAQRINSREIDAGHRLPAERLLAAELDVSRPAIREALHTLQAAGLVQGRRGSGWYVTEHTTDAGALALANWMQLQPVGDVIAVRRVLEPEAIRAIPATQVEAVASQCAVIMSGMRTAMRSGAYDEAARLHSRFHRALAQHTPTRLMRTLIASMIEAAEAAQRTIFAIPRAGMHSLQRHEVILAAIEAGDVDATAREVALHLEPTFTYPIEDHKQQTRGVGIG